MLDTGLAVRDTTGERSHVPRPDLAQGIANVMPGQGGCNLHSRPIKQVASSGFQTDEDTKPPKGKDDVIKVHGTLEQYSFL